MITDNEYLENKGESQSKLKKILLHPYYYINNQNSDLDEPSDVTLIGDAVDMLITQGEDYFNEHFLVSLNERPSGQMGDYVWHLFINRELENRSEIAYEAAGFKRDTLAKVEERFKVEGQAYYNDLIDGLNKKVLSKENYNKVLDIVESLKTNSYVRNFLFNPNYQYMYQVPLYGIYEVSNFPNTPIKGLLDFLIYDPIENILYVTDLKTTSKSLHFFTNTVYEFRYDFQAGFYMKLVECNLINILEHFNISEESAKTLSIKFRFVVESQNHPGAPLIFEMSKEALDIANFGGKVNNREYEGIENAVVRLNFHKEKDLWEYRMEDYFNKGVRII